MALEVGDADPDGDQLKNIFEYAYGLDPKIANSFKEPLMPGIETFGGHDYFTMTYVKNTNLVDITYTPQVAYGLTNPIVWNTGPAHIIPVSTVQTGDVAQVRVRSEQPLSSPSMFMRVTVAPVPSPGFATNILPIFAANCQACHVPGGTSAIRWYDGDVYSNLVGLSAWTQEDVPRVMPGFPEFSHFYGRLISTDPNYRKPYMKPPLLQSEIDLIKLWIQNGAPR